MTGEEQPQYKPSQWGRALIVLPMILLFSSPSLLQSAVKPAPPAPRQGYQQFEAAKLDIDKELPAMLYKKVSIEGVYRGTAKQYPSELEGLTAEPSKVSIAIMRDTPLIILIPYYNISPERMTFVPSRSTLRINGKVRRAKPNSSATKEILYLEADSIDVLAWPERRKLKP